MDLCSTSRGKPLLPWIIRGLMDSCTRHRRFEVQGLELDSLEVEDTFGCPKSEAEQEINRAVRKTPYMIPDFHLVKY